MHCTHPGFEFDSILLAVLTDPPPYAPRQALSQPRLKDLKNEALSFLWAIIVVYLHPQAAQTYGKWELETVMPLKYTWTSNIWMYYYETSVLDNFAVPATISKN